MQGTRKQGIIEFTKDTFLKLIRTELIIEMCAQLHVFIQDYKKRIQ